MSCWPLNVFGMKKTKTKVVSERETQNTGLSVWPPKRERFWQAKVNRLESFSDQRGVCELARGSLLFGKTKSLIKCYITCKVNSSVGTCDSAFKGSF